MGQRLSRRRRNNNAIRVDRMDITSIHLLYDIKNFEAVRTIQIPNLNLEQFP